MKVLFYMPRLAQGLLPKDAGDYMADTIYHGLKSLGVEVHDLDGMPYMYQDYPLYVKCQLWGKGFTTYGLLDPDLKNPISQEEAQANILRKYYDYIIYPIHHTMVHNEDYIQSQIEWLRNYYPKNKVLVIDGWDLPHFNLKTASKCTYFKRELTEEHEDKALPISFAIPEEVINFGGGFDRELPFAPLVPSCNHWNHPHKQTYIYNNQEEYYNDYRRSYYAYTCKKGGWDCMRHYEIIACGAVPFFTDLDDCPKSTLTFLPKRLLTEAKNIEGLHPGLLDTSLTSYDTRNVKVGDDRGDIDEYRFHFPKWHSIRSGIIDHFKAKLTTKTMAEYVLNENR